MSAIGAKLQQAQQFMAQGRPEQARSVLARALQGAAGNPDLNNGMGLILLSTGQGEQALYYLQRAAQARPQDPFILTNLGNCLTMLKREAEAVPILERAIQAAPDLPEARLAIAGALRLLGHFTRAAAELEPGLRARPGDPALAGLYAAVLPHSMRATEAVRFARDAARSMPADAPLLSMLANAINYDHTADASEVFEAHATYGRVVTEAAGPAAPLKNTPDPDRPLRIGILSNDLRRHSVAYFLEPLLRHLDQGAYPITCYSTTHSEDAHTEHLRKLPAAWRSVAKLDDAELAGRIRADGIDILLETSGLTQGHRLPMLASRIAPIQVTFLGYPNTTGIPAIDYRVVDSRTDPAGADALCTERLIRLDPVFLCYAPPADAPPIAPVRPDGPLTFGSFNAAMKLNDTVFDAWSRILKEIPGSRLYLKAFDFRDPALPDAVRARFATRGVGPERIIIDPPSKELGDHLRQYERIDIALDTFPYNGTTTTCEALWMGVPVVTLEGAMHAGRVGLSLLHAAGLPDLVARDVDSYIRLAVDLANDEPRRVQLRQSLRSRVAASPLCDGPAYAARFAAALRQMWRGWCEARAS